jgi:hypothetical protein
MLALEIKLFQSHSIWTQAVISYTYNKYDVVDLSFFKFESKCFASETATASTGFVSKETRIQPQQILYLRKPEFYLNKF